MKKYCIEEHFNITDKAAYPGLYMEYCGYHSPEPNRKTGPSRPPMYVLHYVISGKGSFNVNGNKKYSLKAGDVFLIKPTDIIFHQSDKSESWELCWFGFTGEKAEEILKFIGMDDYVVHLKDDTFYTAVIECIEYFRCNPNRSQMMLEGFLLKGLAAIEYEIKGNAKKEASYIELAKAYIKFNFDKGITVSDIAESIGLSRSHFFRIFKEAEGISPNEYLNNFRMSKAKDLIKNNISFKRVSYAVGINDVYYFSKLFKKKYGITPSEYRKQKLQRE